jgi:hypothetical protein
MKDNATLITFRDLHLAGGEKLVAGSASVCVTSGFCSASRFFACVSRMPKKSL